MKKTVLYHAAFESEGRIYRDGTIVIADGTIQKIQEGWDDRLSEDADCRDMKGLWLYPAWIDSHLHIPGDDLFRHYGVKFQGCDSVDTYIHALQEYSRKERVEGGSEPWIRGFGWSAVVMEEGGYEALKCFLDEAFLHQPVLLFSDDYHNCICNACALRKIRQAGIPVEPDPWGVVREKDIFLLTRDLPQMSFAWEEMEQAVLRYQEKLLKLGITAVQTLMFLGGYGECEWKALKRLDETGKLKLKLNLALTVQPYEDLSQVEQRFQQMKAYESGHIQLRTVKIYMDGVVENRTAFLLSPYEGSADGGRCFWDPEILADFCAEMDARGRQIHIHAIGDGGVRAAVDGLTAAMDRNHSAGRNRHVITHLQLAEDSDLKRMAEYGIIASIQPYWFPQKADYYGLEFPNLGKRAEQEYKAATMEKMGIVVTGSSDSPVTERPDPLKGIAMAAFRFLEAERMTVENMRRAFCEQGAYQLFRETELGQIREGFSADLIGLSCELNEEHAVGSQNPAELCFIMVEGEAVNL